MKTKERVPATVQARLTQLESRALREGIRIHYEVLEAAGIKLRGGLCRINGEYHLFIDKRKSPSDRIELIENELSVLCSSPAAFD